MSSPFNNIVLWLLDWHGHSHHSSGDLEVDAAVTAMVAFALLLMGAGMGFLLAGLLQGGILLPFVGKKRHLFWTIPVLNVVWYLLARAWLLSDTSPLAHVGLGILLASVCGLLSAAFVAPFHALLWKLRRRPGGTAADGGETDASLLLAPLPVGESWIAAFRRGFSAPWEGFGYLWEHPRLWWYGIIPVFLNIVITGAVLLLLLGAAVFFVVELHPLFPAGWGWVALEILCALGCLLLVVGLALVVWAFLQGALCGYYLARLARQVEIQLGLRPEQVRDVSWRYEAADACHDVVALAAINGGFLLLHVVPGIGSALGVAGSLYFDWLLLGEEYFDYPLALRGKLRPEKKEFIRRNRHYTLGLGAAVFLVNFIPVAGAVLLSTAVVGAVLLHRRLEGATAPLPTS